jgi:hypothetical protein
MVKAHNRFMTIGLIVVVLGAVGSMAPGVALAQEEGEDGRNPKPVEIVQPLPLPVDVNGAGIPDVNVASLPSVELLPGASVMVNNGEENPLPVQLVATPPPANYHISNRYYLKCTEGAGGNPELGCFGGEEEINCATSRCPMYEVPSEYYLVIEQINVHRDEEIGDDAYLTVEVYTRLDRVGAGDLWGPVYHRFPIGPKVVNIPVTVYAGNGTEVNVDIHDETVTGDDRYVRVSWTGQLVPAPAPW